MAIDVKMLIIVPYPEIEIQLREIIDNHPEKDLFHADIVFSIPYKLPDNLGSYDVIVGRGYTIDSIKKVNENILCIAIDLNALDVFDALNRCINAWHPRKIAYMWSPSMVEGLEALFKLYDVEIVAYQTSYEKLEETLIRSINDGCDAHVGGHLLDVYYSENYNLQFTKVTNSSKSLLHAVDDAIRAVRVIKRERESSSILNSIVQRVTEGLIHIDANGKICAANSYAMAFGNKIDGELIGHLYSKVFPWMNKPVEKASKGEQIYNELHNFKNYIISASYDPVTVESGIAGVIVTFQNVADIQRQETIIRKKLSEKGNVTRYNFNDIIGSSKLLQNTIETARRYAKSSSNVLLVGETGTGKELLAHSIHNNSEKRNGPFVAVNCAALSESLLESELFGYVEGAFTGASKGGKMGLFEQAHKGTLFLDEITEMPISVQGKLLRVLQEREVRRLGDNKVIFVDLRIISSTNKNIAKLVEEKQFRDDLLYRIDVLKIFVPPVRFRRTDIVEIFMHFIHQQSNRKNTKDIVLSPQGASLLLQHDFMGNAREIQNIAERVLVGNTTGLINEQDIRLALHPDDIAKISVTFPSISYFSDERYHIEKVLSETDNNKTRAARVLGIERSTLWRRMKKHGMLH